MLVNYFEYSRILRNGCILHSCKFLRDLPILHEYEKIIALISLLYFWQHMIWNPLWSSSHLYSPVFYNKQDSPSHCNRLQAVQQLTLRIVEFLRSTVNSACLLYLHERSHRRGLQERQDGLKHIEKIWKYSSRNIFILLFKGQSVEWYCLLFYLGICTW